MASDAQTALGSALPEAISDRIELHWPGGRGGALTVAVAISPRPPPVLAHAIAPSFAYLTPCVWTGWGAQAAPLRATSAGKYDCS